jgi:hypothetical protein
MQAVAASGTRNHSSKTGRVPGCNGCAIDLEPNVHVTQERGQFLDAESGVTVFITIHPSSIYRLRGESERREEYRHFVEDMKSVHHRLQHME